MIGPLQVTVDTSLSLLVFFSIGLLGGAHCLGMCGPLVTLYSDQMDDKGRGITTQALRQHLLLNLGRTASYAVIGLVMGALGAVLFDVAAIASIASLVRGIVGVVVGIGIVGIGIGYVFRGAMPVSGSTSIIGSRFSRIYGTITGLVNRLVDGPGIFGLGMLHGLLPCPILYPAYLYAFARGSPVEGALSLGLLGLGTIPTLFTYGTAFQSVGVDARTRIHRVLGVLFIVLGYLPIAMGLGSFGIHLPMPNIPFVQPLG